MKKILVVSVLCLFSVTGFGQIGSQIQSMLKQIAAYQVYLTTAEKGYKIAETGLQTIGEIKNGEFSLHAAFFSSLKAINPKISKMAEVTEIIALQIAIVEQTSQQLSSLKQNKWMQQTEVTYIDQVFSTILSNSLDDLKDLVSVITASQLTMSDGERIKRIEAIDNNMMGQAGLLKGFSDHANLLVMQRDHENEMIENVKGLYGVP